MVQEIDYDEVGTRVLAHELGHLRSPRGSEINNVRTWENSTMCPIEGYNRVGY